MFRAAEALRFRLIGLGGDLDAAIAQLRAALHPFYVLENHNWTKRADLKLLDATRRDRLIVEVDTLLFLWAVALDREGGGDRLRCALSICDRALVSAAPDGPWRALRLRLAARLGGPPSGPAGADDPSAETSASTCFQWGWLREREGWRDRAIAWLDRAVWLEPGNDWYAYCLADLESRARRLDDALRHYDVAVALRPQGPWARLGRARLQQQRGRAAAPDFQRARDELQRLLQQTRDPAFERHLRRELHLIP